MVEAKLPSGTATLSWAEATSPTGEATWAATKSEMQRARGSPCCALQPCAWLSGRRLSGSRGCSTGAAAARALVIRDGARCKLPAWAVWVTGTVSRSDPLDAAAAGRRPLVDFAAGAEVPPSLVDGRSDAGCETEETRQCRWVCGKNHAINMPYIFGLNVMLQLAWFGVPSPFFCHGLQGTLPTAPPPSSPGLLLLGNGCIVDLSSWFETWQERRGT